MVALIVVVLGFYGWNQYQKGVPTQEAVTKNASVFSTGTSTTQNGITYVTKTYSPADSEINLSYIEITDGLPKSVLSSVNKQLRNRVDNSCYGNPDLPESTADLHDLYNRIPESSLSAERILEATLETMSYKEIRKIIVGAVGYSDYVSAKLLYLDKNVISIAVAYNTYCGGAYPGFGTRGITIDLKTGKLIEYEDLFSNYTRDEKKIASIVFPYLQKVAGIEPMEGQEDLCNFEDRFVSGGASPSISAGLSEGGIVAISLGFPHVIQSCEPGEILIPYSLLKPYLNMNASYMKDLVK